MLIQRLRKPELDKTPKNIHSDGADGTSQACILIGGFFSCGLVLLLCNKSEWFPFFALLLLLFVACIGMLLCLSKNAYGPLTDVLGDGKWMRGECIGDGDYEEDPEDVVRTLYQFSSYDTVKTGWPVVLLYSFLGSIGLGSVITSSTSWILSTFLSFIAMILVQAYIAAFHESHGGMQAQMYMDALYCKYRSLLAYRAGLKSGALGSVGNG